ncbi:TATA-box-binding protein [Candidatus Nanohalococcus occultus]|uniref:TATA-box-binding protein n=1 Tax=Candidatus Nanohalococcus occultus TaxID=2978047 RepID=A0ABY8CES6_9ARCH|nr:TATA-box binding protein (TBP), component of TFIID and TFIIIB [Candidatus Nanohaloarchaeota archaeon SVXNc]
MSKSKLEDENIKIENVVASTTLDRRMPLDRIAIYLENTEYEPEQFPGLVYRLEEPKAAALIFGSGKVVCTGTTSPDQAKEAVDKIIDELREADIEIGSKPEITVQNMVASSEVGATLNLNRIAFELVGTEYEPEQFPGLVYRLDEPSVVFLLFSSGRIVCTGGKTYDDVLEGINKLKENLREIGALE